MFSSQNLPIICFCFFQAFFFWEWLLTRNWKYALLGATFFGLSTYFCIIIAAGHNGKVHTIAYFAPLVASILLVYIRRNYFWGFVATTCVYGFTNHGQSPADDLLSFYWSGVLFPFGTPSCYSED